MEVGQRELRVFEEVEELGAYGCASDCGCYRGPAEGSGDGVSDAAAES